MKKGIDIHGISTTATHKDGDLVTCVNLRKKNGVHKPVTSRKTIKTTSQQYTYEFQHNLPQTGENLIGYRNGKLYLVKPDGVEITIRKTRTIVNYGFGNEITTFEVSPNIGDLKIGDKLISIDGVSQTNGIIAGIDSYYNEVIINGNYTIDAYDNATVVFEETTTVYEIELLSSPALKSITQIGNLLNVLDETGIKILFWVDTEYKIIETNLGGDQTSTELLPVKVDLKVDGEKNTSGKNLVRNYFSDKTNNETTAKTAIHGLFSKSIGLENQFGNITGCMLAICAIELFDGNYILHSNPVYLGLPFDTDTRYTGISIDNTQHDYLNNPVGFKVVASSELDNAELNETYDYYQGYKTKTKAFYNQLQTVETYNLPYIIGNYFQELEDKNNRPYVSISTNKLKFKIQNNIDNKFKELIKSVSIFITKQILPFELNENVDSLQKQKLSYYVGDNTTEVGFSENYYFKYKTNAEILKELADNQQFYKVHEIPFDEIQTTTANGGWVTIDLKDKLGENLIMQEELPVDNFTHHALIPNKQMVYNSKLHVMDYKQELFHGWPRKYFWNIPGVGQEQDGPYNISGYQLQVWAEVHIKTQYGISKVIREFPLQSVTELCTYLNPIISYPDSRATKIIFYEKGVIESSGSYSIIKYEFALTASTTHNFAYYISPNLKPIWGGGNEITNTFVVPTELNRTLIYRNGMKVSSVNNPFYFPAETTYTLGTGFIRNAGTNAMRMSEGQYGQYDLYILTSEGTYSFDTGTEISYNRKAPASLLIPTSDIICSTPYGIIFVAARGLYILSGQEPEFISPQIEENAANSSINSNPLSFMDFLETISDILYDPNQNEIIVISNTLNYNWVYNIENKMWYISTEKIDFEVKNSSPSLLVVEDKKIKDYSQSETNIQTVSFLTRPIYVGIDEVKQLQRAILRAKVFYMNTMQNAGTPFYSLYGSNDSILHTLLRGYNMPENKQDRTYKDFDSGILTRATYRNYSIGFMAAVDEKTEISHLELEITDNYDNDKLR